MRASTFLAFDLGAESGRTILGNLENEKLSIRELTRFPNGMLFILGHWHWNVFRLFEEMKKGLSACVSEAGISPESIALDTWGVDFGLLAEDGSLLGLPFTYRDPRIEGAMEELFQRISRERVYALTGIQFLKFNSLFQLLAMKRAESPLLEVAKDLLFMPDIFNYFFTGKKSTEFTYATTSQLFNPLEQNWEGELFEALGVSRSIMQEVIQPGTIIGDLSKAISQETGLRQIPVITVATHDTGSAVAAVPAEDENWAFISSGTWSCMGAETTMPVITEQALKLNFTNEGGIAGTFRFLKNIMGLWLLHCCRKSWLKERDYSYDELVQASASAPAFKSLIDPDWEKFLNPPDMPEAILAFCRNTGQRELESPAEFVRSILESLALKYRSVLDQLRESLPYSIERIHIIGGGARNRLLSQFTANATGLPVVAGPAEATAVGNILVQALSLGYVASHAEMRRIIRQSFELEKFEPQQVEEWNRAYERFQELVETV